MLIYLLFALVLPIVYAYNCPLNIYAMQQLTPPMEENVCYEIQWNISFIANSTITVILCCDHYGEYEDELDYIDTITSNNTTLYYTCDYGIYYKVITNNPLIHYTLTYDNVAVDGSSCSKVFTTGMVLAFGLPTIACIIGCICNKIRRRTMFNNTTQNMANHMNTTELTPIVTIVTV